MSKDKRVLKNEKVINSIKNLLLDIIKEPKKYELEKDNLIKLFKSQGGLSKYENSNLGIEKTSLNTLKRISPNVIEGGFEKLNELRVEALYKLRNIDNKSGNKNNKKELEDKIKKLENEIKKNKETQLILVQSITKNIRLSNQINNLNDIRKIKDINNINKQEMLNILNYVEEESNNIFNIKEHKKYE